MQPTNGHEDLMRRCLEEVNVPLARRLWSHIAPNMPQPHGDAEVLKIIHLARTAAILPFKMRAYSHAWLHDQGLPSLLPDKLRPKAERIYPPTREAVGIATPSTAVGLIVRGAMEGVVMDYYSTDRLASPDPVKVKRDMLRQRDAVKRKLDKLILGWGAHAVGKVKRG